MHNPLSGKQFRRKVHLLLPGVLRQIDYMFVPVLSFCEVWLWGFICLLRFVIYLFEIIMLNGIRYLIRKK